MCYHNQPTYLSGACMPPRWHLGKGTFFYACISAFSYVWPRSGLILGGPSWAMVGPACVQVKCASALLFDCALHPLRTLGNLPSTPHPFQAITNSLLMQYTGAHISPLCYSRHRAKRLQGLKVDYTLQVPMPLGPQERTGLEWQEADGTMVLDIAPLAGRLILFLSGAVDHAIAPCSADLVAATAWFQ